MHAPRPLVVAASAINYRLGLNARLPVVWQRRLTEFGAAALRPPTGTAIRHVELGGRHAERVSVGASERPRAVLYLHGGAYLLGSARVYRALAGYLAASSGSVVFSLDYRLAPEHVYPAALDDAVAAFRDLVDVPGFDPARIAVAGDSAGGGLALATTRALLDAGLEPGALLLLSPWLDPMDEDMPERDFVSHRSWGRLGARLYRGDADPRDPGYAPMWAKLEGLPPTLVQVGTGEKLNAQVKRFVVLAEDAGVDVTLDELPRLWHSGQVLAGVLREATDAVRDAGRFLRSQLDGRP